MAFTPARTAAAAEEKVRFDNTRECSAEQSVITGCIFV